LVTSSSAKPKGQLVLVRIVHPILQVLLQELESLPTFFLEGIEHYLST